MKRTISLPAAIAGGLLAAIVGAAAIGTVLAQPGTGPGSGSPFDAAPGVKPANAERYCGVFLDTFARELGTERSALLPAAKAAAVAAVDAAVQAGDLTAERATEIKQRIDAFSGDVCTLGRLWHDRPAKAGVRAALRAFGGELADAAATVLKLERSALVEQLRAGDSLREIAAKQQVDYAAVTKAVTDAAKQKLDQAVSSNRLTRERADQMMERLSEWLEDGGEPGEFRIGRNKNNP